MIIFDILRICAALMVFSIHLFIFIPTLPRIVCDILSNGGYGVSIFFVMSGFLIFDSLNRTPSLKEFYRKRVSRIIPAYYAILIVGILVWDVWLGQMPADSFGKIGWLRYFLCLNTWMPSADYQSWNNLWGLWTISCFMFFYLIAPWLKKVINNFRKSAIFMVGMLPATFLLAKIAEHVFELFSISHPEMLACDNPIYSLNTFAIGICAWYAWKEEKISSYLKITTLLLTGFIGINLYNRMLWGLLAGIIMVVFIDLKISNQRIAKAIKIAGRYSFCLYLAHLPVMEIIDYMGIGGMKFLAIAVTGSVLAAVLLYHCVEQPCSRLMKRLGES